METSSWPSVSEHLPGEPAALRPAGPLLALAALTYASLLVVLAALLLPLWPPYLLLAARYGWPPNVVGREEAARYLRAAWTERPPAPGLSFGERAWLTVVILRKLVVQPLWGGAWLLDELLYRRALDAVEVRAPLFEISAGRSGSTQLARYLEEDPHLAAPSILQALFPYLWLWRLFAGPLRSLVPPERVRQAFERSLPAAFRERHEGDPFRTDTYEAALYLAHLNPMSLFLGPDFAAREFSTARVTDTNRALWERDFVDLLDRTGRKHLLHAGPGPDGQPRRLFVKGHFLCAASALARRFPDARFLVMVRDPGPRLRSAVNYLRVNPIDPVLGPPRWAWLAEAVVRSELDYHDAELAWFGAAEGPRRCVVRFEDYLRDLPGTLAYIYARCLDRPSPAGAPPAHPARRRGGYRVDRSLEQLGVDAGALDQRLAAWHQWARGLPAPG